jgi:hypothetical protein
MNDETFSSVDARIARLERQNLILKIVGFGALLFVAFNFGVGKKAVEETQIKAQKFVLVDAQGKECGYLGYDAESRNPRLSLKQCGGSNEQISLRYDNNSPMIMLDAGLPRATLKADREQKMSILYLEGQQGSPGGSSGVARISSGSTATAPQFYLEGREKGRVDIWGNSRQSLRIQDDGSLTRFLINKTNPESIALRFYDKTGTRETFKVPPTP